VVEYAPGIPSEATKDAWKPACRVPRLATEEAAGQSLHRAEACLDGFAELATVVESDVVAANDRRLAWLCDPQNLKQ
jgi:hypothetical protein